MTTLCCVGNIGQRFTDGYSFFSICETHVAKFAGVLTSPVQLKSCETELFTVKSPECPEKLNLKTYIRHMKLKSTWDSLDLDFYVSCFCICKLWLAVLSC